MLRKCENELCLHLQESDFLDLLVRGSGAGQTGVHSAVLVVVVAHRALLHRGTEFAAASVQVAGIVKEVLNLSTRAVVCCE